MFGHILNIMASSHQPEIFELIFHKNNLVSWSSLNGPKVYGMILKTFYRDDDNRSFLMAEVMRTDGKIQILPASVLELESK